MTEQYVPDDTIEVIEALAEEDTPESEQVVESVLGTSSHVELYSILLESEESLTATQIATEEDLVKSTVQTHLRHLYEVGAATRHRHIAPTPGRRPYCYDAVPPGEFAAIVAASLVDGLPSES